MLYNFVVGSFKFDIFLQQYTVSQYVKHIEKYRHIFCSFSIRPFIISPFSLQNDQMRLYCASGDS